MPERIKHTFSRLKAAGQTALIPYITLGDPDLETSFQAIRTLADAGADMIELGVPFTDPVSDGPVIQKACDRALLNPFRMADIFSLTKRVRNSGIEIPLILMSYANPVFALGFENFCSEAVKGGLDAVLITDIPPEEAESYCRAASASRLDTVFLCSPTTSAQRLQKISAASTAYVYYVAHAGVTGARTALPADIGAQLGHLKSSIKNPLCVGFGISTPEQAASLAPHADGLIIGSALVKFFETHQGDDLQQHISTFIKTMKGAMNHASKAA